MTVFLIPCGISIREGLIKQRGAPTGIDFDTQDFDHFARWARHARAGQFDDVAVSWAKEFGSLLVGPGKDGYANHCVYLTRWKPEVSAETDTIAHRAYSASTPVEEGNRAVLIASDTDVGLASAMLVATHIAGGVDRIKQLAVPEFPDQDEWTGEFPQEMVSVVLVRGMDPTAERLRRSVAGLGRVLSVANDQAPENELIEVHFSGGFKSALLYLITMTEVLASRRSRDTVQAWCLHEDGDSAVRIDLRRFGEAHLNVLLRALTEVRDRRPLSPDLAIYRQSGVVDGDRLTPFGAGFLAVLGERVYPDE